MRMHKLIIAVLLCSSTAAAAAGASGLSFLKVGVGARALGMGEAFSAAATDPSAVYYNPAALRLARSSQLTFMHREWVQGTRAEFIGAQVMFDQLALGLGINSTSISDIEIRSTPGPAIGVFTARNASLGASAAYQVDPQLSIGVTGKLVYEKILVDEASGVAFDAGVVYTTPWDFRVAAVLSNLGSVSELRNESSKMPQLFRGGIAYDTPVGGVDGVLLLTADILSVSEESNTHLHFGGEFEYQNTFALRFGYQTGYEGKSIAAGLGVRYGLVMLDYAFVPYTNELGTTHTFSIGLRFE